MFKDLKANVKFGILGYKEINFFYLRIYKLHYLPEKDMLLIAVQPAIFASSFRVGLMMGADSF